MEAFETYEEACKDAVKHMEGKTNNFNFKIFQIPRDEQGRFTWEKIQTKMNNMKFKTPMKVKKNKHNIELVSGEGDKIIIKGNKLNCRWLDSYILVWSEEEHKYD